MFATKLSGESNTTNKTNRTPTVKGLVLSLLVVSSAIPFFLMVPEATPALAQPTVIATIAGLTNANYVAYDPVHERMYVTGSDSGNVYIIDVNTNTETSDSPINIPGTSLDRIAYDPEHERMYVTDFATNNVHVIDTNTNTIVMGTPIDIGSSSAGIAYNPDNQMMYVSAFDDFTVKIIDTDTNTVNPTSISLTPGGQPFGIAYDPDHQRMYVTRPGAPGIVDVIDTTTNTLDTTHGPVTVGDEPQFGIAYDPVHQAMYVPNSGTSDVSVIDTTTTPNTVIATVSGIVFPFGISSDPVNEKMYVTEGVNAPSEVDVIDTNNNMLVGSPISVGTFPLGIAYEPVNGRMYVANFGSDSVSVIQITTATATIDSATGGDNNPVANGGTTTSDEITFTFTGTSTPPTTVASFECSLDDSAFVACTSPHTLTGLAEGEHTFAVRAVDEAGNRQVPPTTFTWTVEEEIDPATAIRELILDVRTLSGVNTNVKITLMTQLRLALNIVSDNNPSNDFIACDHMNSFTTSVNTFQSQGLLTAAQATDLLQQAQAIQNAIGCLIGSSSATS